MKKKLVLLFVLTLILSTFIIHRLSTWIDQQQKHSLAHQARLLHEGIQQRFEISLEGHLAVGILGSRYSSTHSFDHTDYQDFCLSLISQHSEVVGVNIMNSSGVITEVCPLERNRPAKGLKTQHILALQESFARGEDYWFSGPFELHERGPGAVFYFPTVRDKKLDGWLTLPVSLDAFFERLKINSYLENYHLIIQDEMTGMNFFASAPPPGSEKHVYRTRGVMFGRNTHFLSWMKHPTRSYELSWVFCIIIALIISALTTYLFKVKQLRRQEKQQLDKINGILEVTAREASSALNTIEKRLETGASIDREQISGFIFYLNNLINQLTTSNVLAKPSLAPQMKVTNLGPLLHDQIEKARDELNEQGIEIKVDQTSLKDIRINSHEWLLSYSVFGNILRYLIFLSPKGSVIQIIFFQDGDRNVVSFHSDVSYLIDQDQKEILRRGLEVASEVVQLSGGELVIVEKGNDYTIALQFRN